MEIPFIREKKRRQKERKKGKATVPLHGFFFELFLIVGDYFQIRQTKVT